MSSDLSRFNVDFVTVESGYNTLIQNTASVEVSTGAFTTTSSFNNTQTQNIWTEESLLNYDMSSLELVGQINLKEADFRPAAVSGFVFDYGSVRPAKFETFFTPISQFQALGSDL